VAVPERHKQGETVALMAEEVDVRFLTAISLRKVGACARAMEAGRDVR
tara:strand:- start:1529 stop:1672 length:144 start_codon:yes stop_codon:yes gene_type:complete